MPKVIMTVKVKPENKDWLTSFSKEKQRSVSQIIDIMIEDMWFNYKRNNNDSFER